MRCVICDDPDFFVIFCLLSQRETKHVSYFEFQDFYWLSRIKPKWPSYVRYNLKGLIPSDTQASPVYSARPKLLDILCSNYSCSKLSWKIHFCSKTCTRNPIKPPTNLKLNLDFTLQRHLHWNGFLRDNTLSLG